MSYDYPTSFFQNIDFLSCSHANGMICLVQESKYSNKYCTILAGSKQLYGVRCPQREGLLHIIRYYKRYLISAY